MALSHRHANSNCSYEINNNRTGSIKTKTVTFKDSSAETLADEEELQFENLINQMEDANREQRVENISDDENANNLTAEPRQKPRIQMKYQTSDGDHDCPIIAQDEPWGSDGQLEYDTRKSIIIESPCDWSYHLKVFYRKHPPPKKKHLKILTKFAPMDNHPKLRRDASVLAERYNALIFVIFLQPSLSERVVVDGYGCYTALHFNVKAKENQDRVPTLYWSPKLHENPYKARFVANSSSCTTKNFLNFNLMSYSC